MEKFRYVQNKKQTKSLPLDAAQFDAISTDLHLAYICDEARKAKTNGNDEEYDKQKGDLPLAFWIGYNSKGVRQADKQTPTQYFYIDIDHPKMEPKPMWQEIMMNMERVFAKEKTSEDDLTIDIRKRYGIRLVHD